VSAEEPPPLCDACTTARDQPYMTPGHLVHPLDGEPMLFDVRSEAVCPTCGSRWRRTLNVVTLVEGAE